MPDLDNSTMPGSAVLGLRPKAASTSAVAGRQRRRRSGCISAPRRPRQSACACRNCLAFGDRQRERAVENVAGAERIDGVDRERRHLLRCALLVEPHHALRAARDREERPRQLWRSCRSASSRSSRAGGLPCSASLEKIDVRGDVNSPSRIDITTSASSTTGMLAPARLDAEFGAELGAAVLGEHGGAIVQQRRRRRAASHSTVSDRGR